MWSSVQPYLRASSACLPRARLGGARSEADTPRYLARTHESRTHLSREPTTLRTIASTLDSYKEPTTVTSTVVEAHGRTAASRTREGGDVAVPGSSAASLCSHLILQ